MCIRDSPSCQAQVGEVKPSQAIIPSSQEEQSKMMSMANKEHEVQVIHPFHQKPSGSIVLWEFFRKGLFDKAVVNMTSCFEFDNDNDETNEEHSVPLKRDDKVITVPEALQVNMDWQQIFNLLEEIREQIVVTICHEIYMLTR